MNMRPVEELKNSILNKATILLLLCFIVLHLPFTFSKITGTKIWRQAVTAAMSKNIADGNTHFVYPMIDINGHEGITPSEFPAFQGITALFFHLLESDADWIGKLLSLLFGALCVVYVFKILRLAKVSQVSSMMTAISCPILFMYSSKFMPETASLFFALFATYWFYRHKENQTKSAFWISTLSFSLAILMRPYLALMGLPLLISAIQSLGVKNIQNFFYKSFIGVALFVPMLIWYYLWNPHVFQIYQFSHIDFGSPSFSYLNQMLTLDYWHNFLFVWINRYINPTFIFLFFFGFFILIKSLKVHFLEFTVRSNLLLSSVLFPLIAVPTMTILTSYKFFDHEYYMFSFILSSLTVVSYAIDHLTKALNQITLKVLLLLVLGLALGWAYSFSRSVLFVNDLIYCLLPFIGLALFYLKKSNLIHRFSRLAWVLLLIISFSFSYLGHKRGKNDSTYSSFSPKLLKEIKTKTNPSDLFVTYDTQNSVNLWTIRRKGWSTPSKNQIKEVETLNQWKKAGAKWVLALDTDSKFKLVSIEDWIKTHSD